MPKTVRELTLMPDELVTIAGKDGEEAAKHGQEVIESLIAWFQEQGKPLPEPLALPQKPLKVA